MNAPPEIVRDIKRRVAEKVAAAIDGRAAMDAYGEQGGPTEIAVLYLPAELIEHVQKFIDNLVGEGEDDGPEILPPFNHEAN